MKKIIMPLIILFSLSVYAEDSNLSGLFKSEVIRGMDSSTSRYEFDAKKRNVFYVWASWCPYCKKDIPLFLANYNSQVKDCYNIGVSFINVDEDKEKGLRTAKELKVVDVPVFHAPQGEISKVAKGGIPKLIITDNRGAILEVHTGLGATTEAINILKKTVDEKGDCRR